MLVGNLGLEIGDICSYPARSISIVLKSPYVFTLCDLHISSLHIFGQKSFSFDSFWYTFDCIVSLDGVCELAWNVVVEV